MSEIMWKSALELRDMIRSKEISPVEVVTASLERLREVEPKINAFLSIIRGNQDIIGTFIFGGVFQRHPKLKLVCVEADAGWAPHYMYRLDHAYKRHRYWMKCDELEQLPSVYFKENG